MESLFPQPKSKPQPPSSSLIQTLKYSLQYNFPLSLSEVYYWQPGTSHKLADFPHWKFQSHGYLYLPGYKKSVSLRLSRYPISQSKLKLAGKIGQILKVVPTLQAIFVTGSLSMNNSPKEDDIDFMLVTSPHTLWFTRPLVVFILKLLNLRRNPGLFEHSSPLVSNKICDNLYLDSDHLLIDHNPHNFNRSLYLSHEILQAKPLWDKSQIHSRLLQTNSWTKKYLPIAYQKLTQSQPSLLSTNTKFSWLQPIYFCLNVVFFVFQLFYMNPKFTFEKVGLGYAFFHPKIYQPLSKM